MQFHYKELEQLKNIYKLCTKKSQFVFVQGESGVGKTKLVRQFLNILPQNECSITDYHCFLSIKNKFYSPFFELLKNLKNKKFNNVQDTCNSLIKYLQEGSKYTNNIQLKNLYLKNKIQSLFLTLFKEFQKPIILFINQVDYLDSESIDLIHFLATHLIEANFLLILSNENKELTTNFKNNLIIKLSPLSNELTIKFIKSLLIPIEDNDNFCNHIFTLTQGNPLFIQLCMQTFIKKGVIYKKQGWKVNKMLLGKEMTSSKKDEVFLNWFNTYSKEERILLNLLAVFDKGISLDFLKELINNNDFLSQINVELLNILVENDIIIKIQDCFTYKEMALKKIIYKNLSDEELGLYHRTCLNGFKLDMKNDHIFHIQYHSQFLTPKKELISNLDLKLLQGSEICLYSDETINIDLENFIFYLKNKLPDLPFTLSTVPLQVSGKIFNPSKILGNTNLDHAIILSLKPFSTQSFFQNYENNIFLSFYTFHHGTNIPIINGLLFFLLTFFYKKYLTLSHNEECFFDINNFLHQAEFKLQNTAICTTCMKELKQKLESYQIKLLNQVLADLGESSLSFMNIIDFWKLENTSILNSGEVTPDLLNFFCSQYNITTREKEVAKLIVAGYKSEKIEKQLHISASTVRKHIYNIYQKTNIKNRVSLINKIIQNE